MERLCIEAKRRKDIDEIAFLRLFASMHKPSLNQGSVFSLRKCQIRIPLHVFIPRGVIFQKKNFRKSLIFLCLISLETLFLSFFLAHPINHSFIDFTCLLMPKRCGEMPKDSRMDYRAPDQDQLDLFFTDQSLTA